MINTLKNDCYTPAEVIEIMPKLRNDMRWKPNDIGYLYSIGLIDGDYNKSLKKAIVTLEDLPDLMKIYNRVRERKISRM